MAILYLVKTITISKSLDGQGNEMMINPKLPPQIAIQTSNRCQKKAHCLFFHQKIGKIYTTQKIYIFIFKISEEEEGQFEQSEAPRMMSESPVNKTQPLPEARSLFLFSQDNS